MKSLQLPAHHHLHHLLPFPFWWTTSRSSSLSTTRRRLSEHDISIPGTSRCGTSFESYKFEFATSAPSTTQLISSPRLSRALSFRATEIFLGWRITPPFDLLLQRPITHAHLHSRATLVSKGSASMRAVQDRGVGAWALCSTGPAGYITNPSPSCRTAPLCTGDGHRRHGTG